MFVFLLMVRSVRLHRPMTQRNFWQRLPPEFVQHICKRNVPQHPSRSQGRHHRLGAAQQFLRRHGKISGERGIRRSYIEGRFDDRERLSLADAVKERGLQFTGHDGGRSRWMESK